MKFAEKKIAWFILFIGIIYLPQRAAAQPFHRLGFDLPPLQQCAMAWGDFNGDGRPDLAFAGNEYSSSGVASHISRIYRNEKEGLVDIGAPLTGVFDCSLDWADFDRDGDLDLVLAGADGVTSVSCITKIYVNIGGIFSDAGSVLPGVRQCSLKWGDYDHDGWPDLALAGLTAANHPITRIYHNDHGHLVDIHANLTGVYGGKVDWADYDGDGDLDLAVTGAGIYEYAGWKGAVTKIYRNDNGVFVDAQAGLPGLAGGVVTWVDIDRDGAPELALAGRTESSSVIAAIYRYNKGSFTDIKAGLVGVYGAMMAWGDFNGDGYPDLYLGGFSLVSSPSPLPAAKIYVNNKGLFTPIDPPVALFGGDAKWVDFDADGKLDFCASGERIIGSSAMKETCVLLHNDGSGKFSDYLQITRYGSQTPNTNAWIKLDGYHYPALLTFGTSLIEFYGFEIGDCRFYGNNGTRPLSLIGGGSWFYPPHIARGDIDGDGAEDLSISADMGYSREQHTDIYEWQLLYNKNGLLTDWGAKLFKSGMGDLKSGLYSTAIADFDGDGHRDLALSGLYIQPDGLYGKAFTISDIFHQVNPTSFTETNAALPQVKCNIAAADYDKDGWPDLALVSAYDDKTSICAIYHNDHGKFADSGIKLTRLKTGTPVWADVDGDGKIDLTVYGLKTDGTPVIKIYRNAGGGKFTDLGEPLPALNTAGIDWGDYDGDGDLDLAVYGNGFSKIFRNDKLVFTEYNPNFQDTGPMAWGDFDGDGNLDLIVGNRLYRNGRAVKNAVKKWMSY